MPCHQARTREGGSTGRLRGFASLLLVGIAAHGMAAHEAHRTPRATALASRLDAVASPHVVLQPSALERQLFADAADGRFNRLGLAAAALIADGVDSPTELTILLEQIAAHCASVAQQARASSDPMERGRTALAYLHRHVLPGRYRADASSLRQALADGDFNCVSSTVWWCVLAESARLDVWAVASSAHVAAQVHATAGIWDCEPTSPDGFAVSVTTDSAASPRRRLNHAQLISLVYYNRALVALEKGDFSAAFSLNLHSTRLDPEHTAARCNLIATLNAWGLTCVERNDFPQACRLLEAAYQADPDQRALGVNLGYACQQWAAHLASRGAHSEALAVLARALQHPATQDPRLQGTLARGAQRIWWQGW